MSQDDVRAGLIDRLRAAGCVYAEDEADVLLAAAHDAELERLVARRVAGEPLEHVVGWAEFYGLRIVVAPGVFVPRARSSLLVREALRPAASGATIVDLACGAGGIAAALCHQRPDLAVYATDSDPVAVACARRNVEPRGGHVVRGDLFDGLPRTLAGRVDGIVANLPYVPSADVLFMPAEARVHEPLAALDGGPDGTDLQARAAMEAVRWLAPAGFLIIETSRRQASPTAKVMEAAGFTAGVVVEDEWDATAVVGVWGR